MSRRFSGGFGDEGRGMVTLAPSLIGLQLPVSRGADRVEGVPV